METYTSNADEIIRIRAELNRKMNMREDKRNSLKRLDSEIQALYATLDWLQEGMFKHD